MTTSPAGERLPKTTRNTKRVKSTDVKNVLFVEKTKSYSRRWWWRQRSKSSLDDSNSLTWSILISASSNVRRTSLENSQRETKKKQEKQNEKTQARGTHTNDRQKSNGGRRLFGIHEAEIHKSAGRRSNVARGGHTRLT